jgi:zinc transport system substrate-binding protein
MKPVAFLLATTALFGATTAQAEPDVVVSIKPIHSLVASIMEGVGEPGLIVEGAASPHTFTMKPSNARDVQGADVIFWMGPGMEAFLQKPLEALASDAKVVRLDSVDGLEKLPFREGGAFEAHDHGDGHGHGHSHGEHAAEESHEHAHEGEAHDNHAHGDEGHAGHGHDDHGHHHHHGEFDTHIWLDPANAKLMAAAIEKTLAEADPDNATAYAANLTALNTKIDALDAEITALVAPVKDKPFIVFHDAYQYFENHYDVRVAGSITVSPDVMPGAERVTEIQDKVKELGATCVFAEPQFEPKLVQVVTEGTQAKSGTLDPEGGALTEGPELYFDLMRSLGSNLADCLGQDN